MKIGKFKKNLYCQIRHRRRSFGIFYQVLGILTLALLICSAKPVLVRAEEEADCALASKIAEKASQEFAKDQSLGLKYFIQAQGLCPAKPELNFNLGLAYYHYGNRAEAEQYLKKAIEKEKGRADWFNLLAWVMLEQGSEAKQALTYAKEAVKLSPNTGASSAYVDTLIYAYLANNDLYQAAVEAKKARDAYLAFYLKKLEAGHHQEAIEGLAKIDFDLQTATALCWALQKAGQTEEALSRANGLKAKFKSEKSVQTAFDQIMDQYIQSCYRMFQEVKPSEAIYAVEKMKKQYPDCRELAKAYDQMMKVVLKEADTLTVPAPKSYTASETKVAGDSGQLLNKIIQGGGSSSQPVDLEVDVDKDIPKGGQ